MNKVIFDTDPGIDDAMALLFLKRAPGIEIVGVTSSFGNGTIETTTRNLLYLCQALRHRRPGGRGRRPFAGRRGRAGGRLCPWRQRAGRCRHPGVPRTALHEKTADAFIVDMVHRFPHQITLIAVARMTNLALALRRDPSIAGLVKQVIVMGGAFGFHGHTGNVSPAAEANVYGDPLAADEVFGAPWPVTIVGLDVTQEAIMPPEMIKRIGQHGGPEGRFLSEVASFYLGFHKTVEEMEGRFDARPLGRRLYDGPVAVHHAPRADPRGDRGDRRRPDDPEAGSQEAHAAGLAGAAVADHLHRGRRAAPARPLLPDRHRDLSLPRDHRDRPAAVGP